MKECFCRFIGLLFLVSSVVASENGARELDSQLCHAAGGSVVVCKKLLSQGAAVKDRCQGDATPFYAASQEDHEEMVNNLVAHCALLKEKDSFGKTQSMIAVGKQYLKIDEPLKKRIATLAYNTMKPYLLSLARTQRNYELQSLLDDYEHLAPIRNLPDVHEAPADDQSEKDSVSSINHYNREALHIRKKENMLSDAQSSGENLDQVNEPSHYGDVSDLVTK